MMKPVALDDERNHPPNSTEPQNKQTSRKAANPVAPVPISRPKSAPTVAWVDSVSSDDAGRKKKARRDECM